MGKRGGVNTNRAGVANRRNLVFAAALVVGIVLCVSSCQRQSPKFRQYYVQGEILYRQHCTNCHQQDGTGLGLVYPPLDKSDYMEENFEDVICLIRHGISGEIIVNGKRYNQPMPPIRLSDLEVAEIATYIYNTWEHERGIVDVSEVSRILEQCDRVPAEQSLQK